MKNYLKFGSALLILIAFAFVIHSCKDSLNINEDQETKFLTVEQLENRNFRNLEEKTFFSFKQNSIDRRTEPSQFVLRVNDEFYNLNATAEFISTINDGIGVPDWNNVLTDNEQILWVPLMQNEEFNGILHFVIIDNVLLCRPILKSYYEKVYAFTENDALIPALHVMSLLSGEESNILEDHISLRDCGNNCVLTEIGAPGGSTWHCYCDGMGPFLPGCCNGTGNGGDTEELGGIDFDFSGIVEPWNDDANNTVGGIKGGGAGGNSDTENAQLLQDITNEQLVVDWLITYFEIQGYLDDYESEWEGNLLVNLVAANPTIASPLYLYLNGYFEGVDINHTLVQDLMDLLVEHQMLFLDNIELEHILTFEPGLVNDIRVFLDNHANDELAIQVVHDFLALQECDFDPCEHIDYHNEFEVILSLYKISENYEESFDYFSIISLLKTDDPLIRWDRSIELYSLLQDKNALTECGEGPVDNSNWSDLGSFVPPQNVLDRLVELGEEWRLQWLLAPTAAPSLNLDYFSTTITEMPINPATNQAWVPDELFTHIRKNINDFVDTDNSEFSPISGDENLWISNNPVPAILSIDINLPFGVPGDDGTVITAQNEACCWIFSTVIAPQFESTNGDGQNDGYHPVSGNRQFGYFVDSEGNMEIFTKGVDRFLLPPSDIGVVDDLFGYVVEKVAFEGADDLWESFQEGIHNFVTSSSSNGEASINDPIKNRPPAKDALKTILKQNYPIDYVPCGN